MSGDGPKAPARPAVTDDPTKPVGRRNQGHHTVGESVHIGYVDQSRDSIDGTKSVWEEIRR